MKPRIKLIGGLWRCSTLDNDGRKYHVITGFGKEPLSAYDDWKQKWIT